MIHNCDYVSPHAQDSGEGVSNTAQAEHVEPLSPCSICHTGVVYGDGGFRNVECDGDVLFPTEDGMDVGDGIVLVVRRGPCVPSQEAIDRHNINHLPFRSWCSCCVRGRGK